MTIITETKCGRLAHIDGQIDAARTLAYNAAQLRRSPRKMLAEVDRLVIEKWVLMRHTSCPDCRA